MIEPSAHFWGHILLKFVMQFHQTMENIYIPKLSDQNIFDIDDEKQQSEDDTTATSNPFSSNSPNCASKEYDQSVDLFC